MSESMTENVTIVENIHQSNDQIAERNQQQLQAAGVFSLNFMASPGAGKTSLIEHTLRALKDSFNIAVVDGDVASSIDADRAAKAGATAVQINTGGSCHVDANMLHSALAELTLEDFELLLVENVGNLICPASFKLGTNKNVLIASVPEGDDKPYKYPKMYQDVDALVINKIDLMPYIDFDMAYFQKGVEILSPDLLSFPISCKTGEGMDAWLAWLKEEIKHRS